MKKTILKTALVLLIVGTILSAFVGCDFLADLFAYLAAPQGYVVDVKTGDPIASAEVTLTSLETDGLEFTATTSATGYYAFADVEYGEYELTATKDGNTFTKQVVEVSGLNQTLPNIGGFATETGTLSIIVLWDRGFEDVDAVLSFPTAAEDYVTADGFYQILGSTRTTLGPVAGSYVDPSDDITVLINKDVDNFGGTDQMAGGPETFTVTFIPFTYGTAVYATGDYVAVAADPSDLEAGSYDYMGAMIYYLDAYNATNASTDTYGAHQDDALLSAADASALAADPVVYVFYGSTQLGRFSLPEYTDIQTASVLRVNMFVRDEETGNDTEWFQIVPEIGLATTYKGVTDSIIVAGGAAR